MTPFLHKLSLSAFHDPAEELTKTDDHHASISKHRDVHRLHAVFDGFLKVCSGEAESPSASTEFLGTSIHLMSTTFDNVSKCGKFLITCQGSCVGWREAELGHFLRACIALSYGASSSNVAICLA